MRPHPIAALDPRAAAEALKGEGNSCWQRGDAAGAEAAYSRGISAISSRPPVPLVSLLSTLHSSRALSRKAHWGAQAEHRLRAALESPQLNCPRLFARAAAALRSVRPALDAAAAQGHMSW